MPIPLPAKTIAVYGGAFLVALFGAIAYSIATSTPTGSLQAMVSAVAANNPGVAKKYIDQPRLEASVLNMLLERGFPGQTVNPVSRAMAATLARQVSTVQGLSPFLLNPAVTAEDGRINPVIECDSLTRCKVHFSLKEEAQYSLFMERSLSKWNESTLWKIVGIDLPEGHVVSFE